MTAPDPAPTPLAPPVVIGVDSSLTGTGIASSNGWVEVIGYKRTRAKDPGITQLPHIDRIRAMRDLLAQKFSDPVLRKRLAATAPLDLIEGNTWGDRFWGVYEGEGENWLGRLLMEIRDAVETTSDRIGS